MGEKPASEALAQSRHFTPPADIRDLAKMASPIVSTGNQTGEGWFLTGEMMELIHGDVPNIVCIQPFGCLPNHIVGKGCYQRDPQRISDSQYCQPSTMIRVQVKSIS